MRRVDLRHLKGEFLSALGQQIKAGEADEVIIFLFEIGDFCTVNAQYFNVLQMFQHFFGFLFAAFNMDFDCIAQCFGFIGAVLYR